MKYDSNSAYSKCVKMYNRAFDKDSTIHEVSTFLDMYIHNREAVRTSLFEASYKAGGRFDYVTILEKIGIYK